MVPSFKLLSYSDQLKSGIFPEQIDYRILSSSFKSGVPFKMEKVNAKYTIGMYEDMMRPLCTINIC